MFVPGRVQGGGGRGAGRRRGWRRLEAGGALRLLVLPILGIGKNVGFECGGESQERVGKFVKRNYDEVEKPDLALDGIVFAPVAEDRDWEA